MKLIKFVRKPERDGARILYIPLTAEKISQMAVMEAFTDKDGNESPEMYFIDCYGLGTVELSKEQMDLILSEMDKVVTINEYNTELKNGNKDNKETSTENKTSKETSSEESCNCKDEEAKGLVLVNKD